jgi:signal transduction histidine kinase/CheY-like chemotaxis protein
VPDPQSSLLRHAKHLIGVYNPVEILVRSCQEALRVTGSDSAFATCVTARQTWERGTHVAFSGEQRLVSGPARSALFAIHRQLSRQRKLLVLQASAEHRAIFEGLSVDPGGESAIVAVPIQHRRGQLLGELTVVSPAPQLPETGGELLMEIASIASAALESAYRFVFARRDQERLHLLAEASEEALWDWLPDSGELWWGGRIQDLLGHGSAIVQNKIEWKLARVHPDEVERVRRSLQQALVSAESSWKEEYRFQRADESWITVEDRGYFLREPDGRAYRVVGSLRNISPLKHLLEREQEARAAAESANRAKDEFLAMLGHELRNPLAPILTAVHLLRMHGLRQIERERTIIERQARHMIRLVDDLLDISRITRGMVALQTERIELSALVAKAIEMASPLMEERRHHLEVRVPPQGLFVLADPARFAQVLANLLTNAAKYTEPGGRIGVSAERLGDVIALSVTDTGIGISSEMLPHVFDLFVQERQALDRAQGGLGLGLAIVRSLVGLHGGTVSAHSDGRGLGSRFTIRVPATPVEESVTAAFTAEPSLEDGGLGRQILVVDDNEDAAELLAQYLQLRGHVTRIAHDGLEALQLVEQFVPEIVLLDIGLPVLDGYEVARLLRERIQHRQLHLVAVTGYGQEADERRAREAKFDAHLVKPVSMEVLERTLLELIRRPATLAGGAG